MYRRVTMTKDYFIKIRDFLVETRHENPDLHNWDIDRWEFCRSVSHAMNDSYDTWMSTVGIWLDDSGRIEAVVNSEGECNGEAFFQLRQSHYSDQFYKELIDYALEHLAIDHDHKKRLVIRIQEPLTRMIELLTESGFNQGDWAEVNTSMSTDRMFPVDIPGGFRIGDANVTTPDMRAKCHALAFGYHDDALIQKAAKGFLRFEEMPDYRKDLDISILDSEGETAAFCTLWYDAVNKQGILEPVGTSSKHRRKGLAKAAIYEAINRVKKEGCQVVCVGSDQAFYKAIGFTYDYKLLIYEKEWDR